MVPRPTAMGLNTQANTSAVCATAMVRGRAPMGAVFMLASTETIFLMGKVLGDGRMAQVILAISKVGTGTGRAE